MNNCSTIHGNAIAYLNKKAIAIIGDSSSGKTTLSLKLCRCFGFKFISDDSICFNSKSSRIKIIKAKSNLYCYKQQILDITNTHKWKSLTSHITLKYIFLLDQRYLQNIIKRNFNYRKARIIQLPIKNIQQRALFIRRIAYAGNYN